MVDKIFTLTAIIGAACLISGFFMIIDTITLLNTSQKTMATVVDYYIQGEVYYPIFNFLDSSGLKITAQCIDGSTNRMYYIGQIVPIIYNSNNPSTVRVNNLVNIWLGPLFLAGMGALYMILLLGVHFRARSIALLPK